MARGGARQHAAMAISGHRTRGIFDRYNLVSDDDIREAKGQNTRSQCESNRTEK
jgi:hypothetical protein